MREAGNGINQLKTFISSSKCSEEMCTSPSAKNKTQPKEEQVLLFLHFVCVVVERTQIKASVLLIHSSTRSRTSGLQQRLYKTRQL